MKTYTIHEISKMYNLPASTLRYYEESGLLTDVARTENNQRIYSDAHLDQLNAINCFKRTGMPIAKIQEFFTLSQDMESNIDAILQLINEHESSIHQQITKMHYDLAHIQHKQRHYTGIKKAIENHEQWPQWEDFNETNIWSDEQATQVFSAVTEVFPLILTANLSKNTYTMLKHNNFLGFDAPMCGCYDDLIDSGVENIHDNYQENFIRCFSRENLLNAYAQGKNDVYAELYQKGHDGKYQWVSTHVIRTKNQNGDICHISINRILDGINRREGGRIR